LTTAGSLLFWNFLAPAKRFSSSPDCSVLYEVVECDRFECLQRFDRGDCLQELVV
jgi:hypothetical protein